MKNSEILVENSMCRIFSKLKYKIEFKGTFRFMTQRIVQMICYEYFRFIYLKQQFLSNY